MPLTTFSKEMADWWREKEYEVEPAFSTDGIDYWNIEVENDDKELTHPEYVKLTIEEVRQYPDILDVRFSPVLHTVMVNNVVAAMPDSEGELCIPLCRSLKLLRSIFSRPDKGQTPKYKDLKRRKQVLNALKHMQKSGVGKIAYFVTDDIAETFSIETVVGVLEKKWMSSIVT